MTEGNVWFALLAALLFVGGLVAESRVLPWLRPNWYFTTGLPLPARPVPILRAPEGSGETASVRWEVSEPHLVKFWAHPSRRGALSGLHGVVWLAQGRRGVELEVRWFPPWTPIGAALWLAGLGVARGEAPLTVPIAACMLVGLFIVYGERAQRAAAELRWAFVRGGPEAPPPEV